MIIIRFLVAASLLLAAGPAFAYLDPGSASIIIQGAIAAVAGAMVTLKLYWYQITAMFSKSSKTLNDESSLEETDQEDA